MNDGICFHCPAGCKDCTSATNCTSCNTNLVLYLTDTINYCDCPSRQYGTITGFNVSCSACSLSCNNCKYNSTYCTSCNPFTYLMNGTCISNCAAVPTVALYNNQSDWACHNCGTNCLHCVNNTYCTSCSPANPVTWNHNGICRTSCPTGSL